MLVTGLDVNNSVFHPIVQTRIGGIRCLTIEFQKNAGGYLTGICIEKGTCNTGQNSRSFYKGCFYVGFSAI